MEATCPDCGTLQESESTPCSKCGSELRPRGRAELYAPPSSALVAPTGSTDGVWRRGPKLIMHRDAKLPARCVSCAARTDRRLPRRLTWHSPIFYALVLVNLLVYALVAVAVRKTAKVDVPLCATHFKRRYARIAAAWGVAALGVGAPALLIALNPTYEGVPESISVALSIFFLVSIPTALVLGLCASPIGTAKIDGDHVFITKCSPRFLADLPEAPDHL